MRLESHVKEVLTLKKRLHEQKKYIAATNLWIDDTLMYDTDVSLVVRSKRPKLSQ